VETHHTFCRICESLCGLEVDVENNKVVDIRPDAAHVATKGFGCVKGMKQHKLYGSADRLLYPQKRVGDHYERISWEQAFTEIGEKVAKLRAIHPNKVAMYVGTAAGFGVLHPVFAQGFMHGVKSKSMFSSSTQDCANKFAVARLVYGFPFTQPFPDLERTGCLIIVGANPAVSKWSFLQVPNPIETLKGLEARGAKLFIVDPRRTETAKAAGQHVFIRPGTDVFFYLAFLRELIAQGGIDEKVVAEHTTGFAEVAALCQTWTPERQAEVTSIPPETLRAMVTAYRTADGASLYSSTGVNMGGNGGLAFWIQEVINVASGNMDKEGGMLVATGVTDFIKFGKRTGTLLRTDKSRVGQFDSVNDGFPGGILADEILTEGDEQIRALFVTGGNPLITMANSNRLKAAFAELELLVCLDIQMSETASMAHYVLPCTSPLERPDLPFIFPLMLGLQAKPYLQATKAVVQPEGEQLDEATIYTRIAQAAKTPLFGSRVFQWMMERLLKPTLPQEGMLDFLLRLTGQLPFKQLLRYKHGKLRPGHESGSFFDDRVVTDDKRVHLAPPQLLAQAKKLDTDFAAEKENATRLKLISKRHVMTHNSWTHNIPEFAAHGTNHLYMHPLDAKQRGLADGEMVDVRSRTATVRLPMKLLGDLMPGTVALPHGWGHQATHTTVMSQTRGVNVNILAADGPEGIERITGMVHLTGILVDVEKAAGPKNDRDWSGLPA
jgi:anaerobic selenocysteine-containing dehydrogenase